MKVSEYMVGKYVIVRANVAGVHAGLLKTIDGTTCVIEDAYRIWRYYSRDTSGSISDIAANGLKVEANHMIGAKLKSVLIVNPNGLEIAEMTIEAYESIENYVKKTHK